MTSRLQRRKARCIRQKVWPFKVEGRVWDVFVNAEMILGPRMLRITKRQAIHLAHAICISKRHKLEVTCGTDTGHCQGNAHYLNDQEWDEMAEKLTQALGDDVTRPLNMDATSVDDL